VIEIIVAAVGERDAEVRGRDDLKNPQ
jgi:hypothetical protein